MGIELLGAPIGSTQYKEWFVDQKVSKAILRVNAMQVLHPQVASTLMNKSIIHQLMYLSWVVPHEIYGQV